MAVFRKAFVSILFLLFCFNSYAQIAKRSFEFVEEDFTSSLKTSVEAFGYYLSFKPDIFNQKQPVTNKYVQKTLREYLESLLGDEYDYKIIQKYIIITQAVKKISTNTKNPDKLFYDTVYVKEKIISYDTQVVEVKNFIYDTIKIPKQVIFYDTIDYVKVSAGNEKALSFGGYAGPVIRKRSESDSDAIYSGFSLGLTANYQLKHFAVQLDLSYQYLTDQVKNTSVEEVNDIVIDTISTFFIIENGVRVPVYITETTEIPRRIERQIERTNVLHYFSSTISGGYEIAFKNISIGAYLGIHTDWLLSGNEILFINEKKVEENGIDRQSPQVNLQIQLPFTIKRTNLIGAFTIAPYYQYGINKSLKTPDIAGNRQVFGIKVGVLF